MIALMYTGKPFRPPEEPKPKPPKIDLDLILAFFVALLMSDPRILIGVTFLLILASIGIVSIHGLIRFLQEL